jgi:uncharacterized protein YutE (UPF0331/DUF86 family)
MPDRLRIESRIAEIRKRVINLQRIAESTGLEDFVVDKNFAASAAERNLEVVIQACLDIASHLVAELALEKPKDNKELFSILAKNKIISMGLSKRLILMGGMRNILAHEYLDIDGDRIYEALQNDLGDITEYVRMIELFLDKESAS